MLCYWGIVVCTAYVNLNLDVNAIFSALHRTNRRFYKRQSLFIYMPPQRTRPRCSTMDSCSESLLLLQRHSSTNQTPSSNIIRGRCVTMLYEYSLSNFTLTLWLATTAPCVNFHVYFRNMPPDNSPREEMSLVTSYDNNGLWRHLLLLIPFFFVHLLAIRFPCCYLQHY